MTYANALQSFRLLKGLLVYQTDASGSYTAGFTFESVARG
jgi:hypothetical protein